MLEATGRGAEALQAARADVAARRPPAQLGVHHRRDRARAVRRAGVRAAGPARPRPPTSTRGVCWPGRTRCTCAPRPTTSAGSGPCSPRWSRRCSTRAFARSARLGRPLDPAAAGGARRGGQHRPAGRARRPGRHLRRPRGPAGDRLAGPGPDHRPLRRPGAPPCSTTTGPSSSCPARRPATLDHASHLVGDEERGGALGHPGGRRAARPPRPGSTRRLLPPDALRRLAPGTGVLVYGGLPPARLRLRPWWEDPVLAARGGPAPTTGPPARRYARRGGRLRAHRPPVVD